MKWVIVDKDGLLYGGVFDSKLMWYKTKRKECEMEEEICVKALSQLSALGIDGLTRHRADSIVRGWIQKG